MACPPCKRLYLKLGVVTFLAYFGVAYGVFALSGQRLQRRFDPALGCGVVGSGVLLIRYHEGNRPKAYIVVLMVFCTIPYLFHSFGLALIFELWSQSAVSVFLIFYLAIISLFEAFPLVVIWLVPEVDKLSDKIMQPVGRFMTTFFESLRYGIAVFSFDEEKPLSFISFLIVGVVTEVITRLRIGPLLFYKLKSQITNKRIEMPSRSRFSQGTYGSRYEMEYIPVLFLIFLRITQMVLYIQPGNHVDEEGTPDHAFNLPIWTYFAFIAAEVFSDIGTYVLSRVCKLEENLRTFEVSSWAVSFVGIFAALNITMVNILSSSTIFFDYR